MYSHIFMARIWTIAMSYTLFLYLLIVGKSTILADVSNYQDVDSMSTNCRKKYNTCGCCKFIKMWRQYLTCLVSHMEFMQFSLI